MVYSCLRCCASCGDLSLLIGSDLTEAGFVRTEVLALTDSGLPDGLGVALASEAEAVASVRLVGPGLAAVVADAGIPALLLGRNGKAAVDDDAPGARLAVAAARHVIGILGGANLGGGIGGGNAGSGVAHAILDLALGVDEALALKLAEVAVAGLGLVADLAALVGLVVLNSDTGVGLVVAAVSTVPAHDLVVAGGAGGDVADTVVLLGAHAVHDAVVAPRAVLDGSGAGEALRRLELDVAGTLNLKHAVDVGLPDVGGTLGGVGVGVSPRAPVADNAFLRALVDGVALLGLGAHLLGGAGVVAHLEVAASGVGTGVGENEKLGPGPGAFATAGDGALAPLAPLGPGATRAVGGGGGGVLG